MIRDLISIILPVYMCEEYISKCVNSILNQTYKKFELIIINDGSPDRCHDICENFAKKDCRIKYYFQNNQGVSSARNYGLSFANGEYVTFIDSDDYILMNHLEKLYTAMKTYKCDLVSLSYNDYKRIRIYQYNQEETFLEMLLNDSFGVAVHNKLYKSNIIFNNGLLFDSKKKISEDFEFLVNYVGFINSSVYIEQKNTYIKVNSKFSSASLTNYNDKLDGLMYGYNLINQNKFASNKKIIEALKIREFRICVGTYIFYPEPVEGQYTIFIKKYIKDHYRHCLFSRHVEFRYKLFASIILINNNIVKLLNRYILPLKY